MSPEIGPDDLEDGDDVVETDFVPGGWAQWDLSAPPVQSSRSSAPTISPGAQAEQSAALLDRAVAEMMVTWRTDRGLRQSDAAAHLGLTQSWLSRIERCQAAVSIEMLVRLASYTGSDVSIRIVPDPAGRPARWIARSGQVGRATVQFAIAGPEMRRPEEGWGADRRGSGPIF